jgi:hypothetical protein
MSYKFNPYYAKTRSDFYSEHLFPKDPKRYLDFHTECNSFISTSKVITFKNLHFGESYEKVIASLGQPRFKIENAYSDFAIKVIFYKEEINELRVISQLHFFEGKFFYANYSILNWTNKDLLNYKGIVLKKYAHENDCPVLDQDKITGLSDERNNLLLIFSDIFLHFTYYSNNTFIQDQLKKIEETEFQKKLVKQQIAYDFF